MFLSYTRLKNDFVQMCTPYINDTNFFTLKNFFEKDLNSVRRLSYCYNLDELIRLLEKADILNEGNVTSLKQIVTNIGEQNLRNFLPYIELYEKQPTIEIQGNSPANLTYNQSNTVHHQSPVISNNPQRIQPVTPSAPPYIPPVIQSAPQSLPHIQQNYPQNVLQQNFHTDDIVRDTCFKIISDRLGNKWKDVGRALGLREGDMDDITKKYKNNIPRILEMLHRFEEEPLYERRYLRTRLTEALRKAKRQDLVLIVADVFDRHS